MNLLEKMALLAISYGSDTLEKLCFELDLDLGITSKIIKKLKQNGNIKFNGQKISLTASGLSITSKKFIKKDKKIFYKPSSFFVYLNNLGKDVIFLPYLEIDARENFIDDYTYKLYRIEMNLTDIEINVLDSLESLLCDISPLSRGFFWILKSDKSSCGVEMKNLIMAMKKMKITECEIKLAFSEPCYVMIILGKIRNEKIEKISLIFYLSNCGEWSYVDVIKYINRKIRPFLNFGNVEFIPTGKEVIIKNLPFKGRYDSDGRSFLPNVLGKFFLKEEGVKEAIPLIVAIDPKNINSLGDLKKVTPWFICCNGGFLNRDFKEKRRFIFHWVEHWNFPELIIVQLIVNPSYNLKNLCSRI
jgi:hypothetical protein